MRKTVVLSALAGALLAAPAHAAGQDSLAAMVVEGDYSRCVMLQAEKLWAASHDRAQTKSKALAVCQHFVAYENLRDIYAAKHMRDLALGNVDFVIRKAQGN